MPAIKNDLSTCPHCPQMPTLLVRAKCPHAYVDNVDNLKTTCPHCPQCASY